jgi:bifunctional polynucleotide phosphatase/kinase
VFRKPRPGAWEFLEKYKNGGITLDMTKSFYCGDAGGRIRSKGKKDFSCSDRLFAANVGVRFTVPEETFLQQKCTDQVAWPEFNPKSLLENAPPLLEPVGTPVTVPHQEVALMVGVQGSGKSYFAEKYLAKAGYTVICNDKTGSRDKSLTAMKKALGSGRSVVVDNTHVNAEARQKFIDIATRFAVPCRCFVMATSPAQARHNIVFREITDKEHVHIGEPLINGYLSKYKPPAKEEGFTEIVKVNVVPDFKYEQHHILYHMYLVEK